ncbi:MAG: hypothetical protein VB049_03020 [Candidatus Pelethousia sp.]|nr:hypothetical protein [Candidatus Pelethousia sp.]
MDCRKHRLLPALIIATGLILLGLMLYSAFAGKQYGHMDVLVVDAYSLEPLQNAMLVFPDSGIQATTNEMGRAQVFSLPIQRHREQNRLLPQPYGECTLLVFREGYIPYALFYIQLQPGRIRSGPTIYLFPEYEGAPGVITVVESPTYEWTEELVKRYRPQ